MMVRYCLYVGGIDSTLRVHDIQATKHVYFNDHVVNGISYYSHESSNRKVAASPDFGYRKESNDDDKRSSSSSIYIAATIGLRIFPSDHAYDYSSSDDVGYENSNNINIVNNIKSTTSATILGRRQQ